MFRLIPWSIGGNKVAADEVKMLALSQQKPPNVGGPSPQKLKRKRTNSSEFGQMRDANRMSSPRIKTESCGNISAEPCNGNTMSHCPSISSRPSTSPAVTQPVAMLQDNEGDGEHSKTQNSCTPASCPVATSSSRKMDVETLRQTLTAQLSLEVLLKHNELRLIDQEIAKCQIALDQLRRCSEIPYPSSSISGISQTLSSGTGFAVRPGAGKQPTSPSPWGITEGPYSRHYSRWLLPDPRFDGGDVEPSNYGAGKTPAEGRTTRGSWAEGSSRSQRASAGSKLQALSNGYPPPKDRAGPMIMKRKSDGKMVKLACLDCRRDNFSSTQGFINHCRIAHNRSFASHDAAAEASGEPVEVDETGAVILPAGEPLSNAPPGYVHPLIRSAHLLNSTTAKDAIQKRTPSKASREEKVVKTPKDNTSKNNIVPTTLTPQILKCKIATSPDFVGSPQTPHLSALMQSKGLGLDLLNIVDDALIKTDIEASYLSSNESDEDAMDVDVDVTPKVENAHHFRSTRLPARTVATTAPAQRPSSRKGTDKALRIGTDKVSRIGTEKVSRMAPPPTRNPLAVPAPYGHHQYPLNSAMRPNSMDGRRVSQGNDIEMPDANPINLSPNTADMNQAPSLVSDNDFGVHSESESPSPSPSISGRNDISFDNVEVRDGFDASADGSTTSTTSVEYSEPHKRRSSTMSRQTPPSPLTKRSVKPSHASTINGDKMELEPKHVTVLSPPASPTKNKKSANNRKPRRNKP